MRIRLLVGAGGSGKTRLAAEVAETLRLDGWHVGFSPLEQESCLPLSDRGLFLILDYPEAWREQVRRLLRKAARIEKLPAPVRIILLSRRSLDEWNEEILQCGASLLCDAVDVYLSALTSDEALALFQYVVARLAQHRHQAIPQFDDLAFRDWLAGQTGDYALPLLVTAAAIHFVDIAGNTFDLRGSEIISALVNRERTQLDRLGKNAGWGPQAASRLVGLAALRYGLDASTIRRLAAPNLEIGLPEPEFAVDAVQHLAGWEHDRLFAPAPDIVAAELLRQVLIDAKDRATDWLWAVLSDQDALKVELIGRRVYDLVTLHGPAELLLRKMFCEAVTGNVTRAETWRAFLDDGAGGFRLSPVAIAVARTLLSRSTVADSERARILNNLANRLHEAGDNPGALQTIREAVDIRRRLVRENPARFEPVLATSLNNLSNLLDEVGDNPGALQTIREAVDIRRRLVRENPARFEPVLA
ncbi:MAG: tetratricopeptide repeat protein, partial [Sulfuricaulis sp.]